MSETKDWRKICAACQEGEPPEDCEYFGEPGGCNAKTMGKHPTCEKSLQVGDRMLDLLNRVHDFLGKLCRDGRCDDHCSECIGASDLADDVWDLIQSCKEHSQVGNAAELREAVESLLELLYDNGIDEDTVMISHENSVLRESLHTERTLAVLRKAKSALAEPLKNCEVGTAEEQSMRFYDYCLTNSKDPVACLGCPLRDKSEMCESVWEQMPYESEVSHGKN
jgi:hypothetical protein